MNAESLAQIGRACFGEQWQHDLARELMVPDRRVRYWLADDPRYPIPAREVIAMTIRRREAIYEAIREFWP